MSLVELAKKARELGSQYEEVYNAILNELFNLIPDCQALHFEDSLLPVYAVSALKTKGLLAFPYKCRGSDGLRNNNRGRETALRGRGGRRI
ncbi:MAG: hypothetical protein L7H02_04835 [Sulfolobales archaeon]|nr:hypothetical protein [Sulfolobales archaeon]